MEQTEQSLEEHDRRLQEERKEFRKCVQKSKVKIAFSTLLGFAPKRKQSSDVEDLSC
jgi:hypothetical protein